MATRIAKKIVVVGGGNSAGYFARAVVAAGRGADLTVISAEDVLPYERPALTKAFLNETGPARLPGFHTSVGGGGERQNQEWYDANGVEVHLGTRVVSWDAASKTVTTDTSASFGYEKLIVAIGCTALKLPASMGGDLPGVHYVRDHADALALYDAMSKARAPVVIGGGYIGLEAAAAFAARGAKPAVVMMEPHVMARLWTPTIAAHYEALYESKGCVFHKNAKVSAIARGEDGRVKSVELEGGASLPADLVVVGVGAGAVTAPFDALDTTPDARNPGGVLVDATFAASGVNVEPKSVYAIGDIAAFPLAFDKNQTVRMEHVAHARASAAHCARCVLAAADDDAQTANAPYQYTPYFYSRVFEQADSTRKVAWVFYGLQRGEVVCVGDFAPKLAAFWVDEGVCVGAMLESGTPDEVKAVQAIAEGRPSVDVEKLRACATAEAALSLFA